MVEAVPPSSGSVQTKPLGANRTPYENYKELMDDSLNKIIKGVNKSKNKELITLCQQALETVVTD